MQNKVFISYQGSVMIWYFEIIDAFKASHKDFKIWSRMSCSSCQQVPVSRVINLSAKQFVWYVVKFMSCIIVLQPQFYIQLINRPHFGTGILLGSQGSKEKKVDFRNSEQLLRAVFSTFCGHKKVKFFLKNVLASALMAFNFIFFFLNRLLLN